VAYGAGMSVRINYNVLATKHQRTIWHRTIYFRFWNNWH